jgi:hypothetical protein
MLNLRFEAGWVSSTIRNLINWANDSSLMPQGETFRRRHPLPRPLSHSDPHHCSPPALHDGATSEPNHAALSLGWSRTADRRTPHAEVEECRRCEERAGSITCAGSIPAPPPRLPSTSPTFTLSSLRHLVQKCSLAQIILTKLLLGNVKKIMVVEIGIREKKLVVWNIIKYGW